MDHAPLTLRVLEISPPTLIPSSEQSQALNTSYEPLPQTAELLPPPPANFVFSPTANYPTPFGALSLGSTLCLNLELVNTHPAQHAVLGVRMMVEVQGPSGRYRLGEVVHSPTTTESTIADATTAQKTEIDDPPALPELKHGESIKIRVENEMKDLGLNIIIVSAAWETLDGRRTLQRFMKFNVNPPLAIKTRIQTPSHPNTSLDPIKRQDVYLEILMQNTSGQGMVLSRVVLEPVQGMKSRSVNSFFSISTTNTQIGGDDGDDISKEDGDELNKETLLPSDTRQYLFILSPDNDSTGLDESNSDIPRSIFPPIYAGGTILPLGRLDVSWYSGSYHIPGRLQTSTLNRRVPLIPLTPSGSRYTKLIRESSNQGVVGQDIVTPIPRTQTSASTLVQEEETKPRPEWGYEYDLTVKGDRTVDVEDILTLNLKLAVRSLAMSSVSARDRDRQGETNINSDENPLKSDGNDMQTPPRIGIQYLTPTTTTSHTSTSSNASNAPLPLPASLATSATGAGTKPSLALSPPSRSTTPLSTTSTQPRPYSPLTPSRTGTPLSAQLRQAVGSHLALTSGLNPTSSKVQFDAAGEAFTTTASINNTATATSSGSASGSDTFMTVSFPPQPILIVDNSTDTTNKPLPQLHHPDSLKRPNSNFNFTPMMNTGQLIHIGNSLFPPSSSLPLPLSKVRENKGPTYNDQKQNQGDDDESGIRLEVVYDFPIEFFALQQGLSTLGGLRILLFHNHNHNDYNDPQDGQGESGIVVREWDSLGDVWITD